MLDEVTSEKRALHRLLRVTLIFLGIALSQFVLYGPSLIGHKILLPLDILSGEGFYLPQTPEIVGIQPRDGSLADLICTAEPQRRFAASELQAGRLPMWAPYHYAGAPFVWPKFSPFLELQASTQSPVVLAWSQLLVAFVAGLGAYLFFRRALGVSFWPAAICSWCYPLTAFFVLWLGFFTVMPVCWLPWLLLTVDNTVRGTGRLAPIGLAWLTCLVVVSGQLDVAGQVLLVSGQYALWRLFEAHREQPLQEPPHPDSEEKCKDSLDRLRRIPWPPRRVFVGLGAGWALGLLLAMPYVLPVLEYTQTGARMARRGTGTEERPPVGVTALPQIVLPDMYGTRQVPSLRYAGGPVQQESSASGYAGVIATLLVAPLAFCNQRRRARNTLWVALSVFGLSWCLNLPGLVTLLRLPGLNMMSHNRLVFIVCFALLALAAIGLDTLLHEPLRWRKWMWLPLALLAGLCAWCAYRSVCLPEPISAGIAKAISQGGTADWIRGLNGVRLAQAWFVQYYSTAAVWCGLGAVGWILLRSGRVKQNRLVPLFGMLLVGELLWFGYGRPVQSDPALYYPPIPVLQDVAKAAPGRVMGFGCLPATLSAMCGLRDIRGYDAVDPARLVELVMSAAEPISRKPRYAVTMQLAPKATITPGGDIQLPPVLDMLGVRYVIFRGSPFPKTHPLFQGLDYWVLQNPRALARAFVPHHVELVTNDAVRLSKIESPDFNPAEVAYVEVPITAPGSCRGTAEITDEIPTRVTVSVRMETPGLVVLADLWDKGWRAYLDGKPVPILRANHAVRGVVVPAGAQTLQFRYEPASFTWGLRLAGTSAVILLAWLGISLRRGEKLRPAQPVLP
ncbi:MAG TPA: hypothetical protein VNZ64_21540 [Candidatus Acidoferrum sp.]|jgi:hypothetical protein|nr:hypothetical protein [Candidatus Acidoferrum sp.]